VLHDTPLAATADDLRSGRTDPVEYAAQQEALSLAFDRGYFEIPRRVTLVELGDEVGVSDQALSERLRRAQTKLACAMVNSGGPTALC